MGRSEHQLDRQRNSALNRLFVWAKLHVGSDPEWLISTGRLVTALFAVLAIYLDPTRPAGSLKETHVLLVAYLGFALVLTLNRPHRALGSPFHLIIHGIDVLALAVLVYLTDELGSPFFSFMPFFLMAITLRWGMRGAVLGALIMESIMTTVGWSDITGGDSELNVFIMRSGYFLVAAGMLGYFGAYRARSRHRFATLAAWPLAPASRNEPALLRDLLDHASQVLGTSRLLLIWRDRQSADGKLVLFGPGGLTCADPLAPQFWQARAVSLNHQDLPPKLERAEIAAIASATTWHELFTDLHDLRSASFSGARFIGRLYVLDPHYSHEDAAALEQITALRIGQELERFALTKAIADTARDQERVRLARDLHDGVLQNLTAATLKLRAAAATVPHEARQSLQSVSELVIEQQRSIRLFVEESRTMDVATVHRRSPSLSQNVSELSNRWDCDIDLKINPPDMELPLPVLRELTRLLSEATANAVRHGGATRLNVELCRMGHGLSLTIADNGCGMTASGDNPPWPRSLHARVEDLEGNLAITRYAPGLALRIEVPLP